MQTSKQKIYVACALTQAPQPYKHFVEELKNALREKYDVLDFFGLAAGSASEIYEHDKACVHECDLLLCEVSFPAIGLGFEIGTAVYLHKPILAAATRDATVSRLVLGITEPSFKFIRYTDTAEILSTVDATMASIAAKTDNK